MMASWKPKHAVKHYLKLKKYFINCCVVTVFNKEICHRIFLVTFLSCYSSGLEVFFFGISAILFSEQLTCTALWLPKHGDQARSWQVMSPWSPTEGDNKYKTKRR
jgi:hypothetical protein